MPFSVGTVMGSTPWAATVMTSPLLLTAAVLGTVLTPPVVRLLSMLVRLTVEETTVELMAVAVGFMELLLLLFDGIILV